MYQDLLNYFEEESGGMYKKIFEFFRFNSKNGYDKPLKNVKMKYVVIMIVLISLKTYI